MAAANVQGTLKVESLVLHEDRDFRRMNLREPIALFQDGVVLVSWDGPHHVMNLGNQGNLSNVGWYRNETGRAWIHGLCTYNNRIYVAEEKAIKVGSGGGPTREYYPPNIPKINKILVVDESTILISDGGNPGSVYKYTTESNQTQEVVSKLDQPSYICMAKSGEDTRYIVSESGPYGRIFIYDENWENLTTIRGRRGSGHDQSLEPELNSWCPKAMAVTEKGEVLVADHYNSTINHYNLEGQLLDHVVTSQDGLENPDGIAYRFPYLWVCRNNEYVKCFKMKYE